MTTYRSHAVSFALIMVAMVISLSCFIGDDEEPVPGGSDPEAAVRGLINALEDNKLDEISHYIDPSYSADEVGVGDMLRLRDTSKRLEFTNLRLSQDPSTTDTHARVVLSAIVATDQGETALTDQVLLTSVINDRWYITSPDSEYWRSQLRPPPSAWQQMQADDNPALPGRYVPPHPGPDGVLLNDSRDDRIHLANDRELPICTPEQIAANTISDPLCYPSNPPTSGPHAAVAAPFRVHVQPVSKEFFVHSMEHGGVVIWHNTADQTVIQTLAALTEASISRGLFVALTPYPHMEPETIALTAWTRIDSFPAVELDVERIQRFITAHERRFNPEGF